MVTWEQMVAHMSMQAAQPRPWEGISQWPLTTWDVTPAIFDKLVESMTTSLHADIVAFVVRDPRFGDVTVRRFDRTV